MASYSLEEKRDEVLTILSRFQLLTSREDNVFEARQTLTNEAYGIINEREARVEP